MFLTPSDHAILIRALNKNGKVLESVKAFRSVQIYVHPAFHVAHVMGENHVRAKEDILKVIKGLP